MILSVFLVLMPTFCLGFLDRNILTFSSCYSVIRTEANLVPLTKFSDELTYFLGTDEERCCIDSSGKFHSEEGIYELGLVEEEDLPDLCKFVVSTFGADAIRLSQDINAFERLLMSPAAELINGYSGLVAFAEVFSGTKQRLKNRLKAMDIRAPQLKGKSRTEMVEKAENDSLILALARRNLVERNARTEVIASIELRLQPCDAKIPFSLPWLDKVERRLAGTIGLGEGNVKDLQPYLSNLCVDEKFRGRKIGRALVRCVQDIAKCGWGYSRIYLHVDEENVAALRLYQSEGYRDVGHRWNPFWAGSAAQIGYFVKTLHGPKG